MRKFVLYFLLILLIVAVGTFSYGFWNGKKVRDFAVQLSLVKNNHNFASQIEEIEESFGKSGGKETAVIREETRRLKDKLDEISQESEIAKKEIEALKAPKLAKPAKYAMADYFSRVNKQTAELESIIDFMSQIIEVAAVLGEIGESASLEDVKSLIVEAKEKSHAIQTEILPLAIRESAQDLKDSMSVFLSKLEEMVVLASQDTAQLDAAYADFSKREDEFFSVAKRHIGEMEDLSVIENKMSADIERLRKVKFSLR